MGTDIHYDERTDRVRRNSLRADTEHIDSQTLARLRDTARRDAPTLWEVLLR